MADWVLAAERAYVAVAVGSRASPRRAPGDAPATLAGSADRAPVAAADHDPAEPGGSLTPARRARAIAAAGAVASRYLAVGTPRSFGIVIDAVTDVDDAALSLVAHRTWFDPRDIRCAATGAGAAELAAATTGRVVSVAEVLACDIVNVYSATVRVTPAALRRGTHVNALNDGVLDAELHQLATVVHEVNLPALAAGLVDGRQLDELTIFVIDRAPIAAETV